MSEILKCDELGKGKKTLIIMIGLPYSGKSTAAREYDCPIVNPDSIRVALHGHKFIPEAEPHVWAIAKTMVRALFLAGHDYVVLDATNLTEARRTEWRSKDWGSHFRVIDTDYDVCIERIMEAGDHPMVEITHSMSKKIEALTVKERTYAVGIGDQVCGHPPRVSGDKS
jgi:predicted kinase